jgi:galactan endo-1,6-beta-galactosidase
MSHLKKSLLTSIIFSSFLGASYVHADYTLNVNKNDTRGIWEGWGCSLAWWGKAVGNSRYQDTYADLIFTTKNVSFNGANLPGLGLNIARYNIGGGGLAGDIPRLVENKPGSMPWYKDIDGYWTNWNSTDIASSSWDWYRDSNQRNLMWSARDRGAKFEFFSNAPMWWMTNEKSSAGGKLQEWNRRDYARYLASVTQYAQQNWGVNVPYLEPFNEPIAGWWNYPKVQEGVNISQSVQKEILGYLREELNSRGLNSTKITASDENTMNQAISTYNYFKSQTVSVNGNKRNLADLVDKVNVHAYNGLAPWRDNAARRNLKSTVGNKPIWMSEYGDNDGDGMVLAQTITEDLNHLKPSGWIYWQPVEAGGSWGLVNGQFGSASDENSDTRAKPSWIYYKYYAFAQFTRFLRPGYSVLGSSDNNSIVGYGSAEKKLVLITVNYRNAQRINYDLSSITTIPGTSVSVTATNTSGSKLLSESSVSINNKKFTINAEANTIYSIAITGVTL